MSQRLPDPGALKTLFAGLGSEMTAFSSLLLSRNPGQQCQKAILSSSRHGHCLHKHEKFGRWTEWVVLPGLLLICHIVHMMDVKHLCLVRFLREELCLSRGNGRGWSQVSKSTDIGVGKTGSSLDAFSSDVGDQEWVPEPWSHRSLICKMDISLRGLLCWIKEVIDLQVQPQCLAHEREWLVLWINYSDSNS